MDISGEKKRLRLELQALLSRVESMDKDGTIPNQLWPVTQFKLHCDSPLHITWKVPEDTVLIPGDTLDLNVDLSFDGEEKP